MYSTKQSLLVILESTCSTFNWNQHIHIKCWHRDWGRPPRGRRGSRARPTLPWFHMQTIIICKLGFNQNYNTFTLVLLTNMDVCGKFPWTKFINYEAGEVRALMKVRPCRGISSHTTYELNGFSRVISPTEPSTHCLSLLVTKASR